MCFVVFIVCAISFGAAAEAAPLEKKETKDGQCIYACQDTFTQIVGQEPITLCSPNNKWLRNDMLLQAENTHPPEGSLLLQQVHLACEQKKCGTAYTKTLDGKTIAINRCTDESFDYEKFNRDQEQREKDFNARRPEGDPMIATMRMKSPDLPDLGGFDPLAVAEMAEMFNNPPEMTEFSDGTAPIKAIEDIVNQGNPVAEALLESRMSPFSSSAFVPTDTSRLSPGTQNGQNGIRAQGRFSQDSNFQSSNQTTFDNNQGQQTSPSNQSSPNFFQRVGNAVRTFWDNLRSFRFIAPAN